MFKSLVTFTFDSGIPATPDLLAEQLVKRPFQPCGSQDRQSTGWVAPREECDLVVNVGGHWLLALKTEVRILPTSVVKAEVAERVRAITNNQGRRVGRKEAKEIQEEVVRELLPRAFTKQHVTFVWIDVKAQRIGVIGVTAKRGADVMHFLITSLATPPKASILATELPAAAGMTAWLSAGEAPPQFTIDDSCELVNGDKASVRYAKHSLDIPDLREHLAGGKSPKHLALTFADRVSFVLTANLELKRIKLLDTQEASETPEDAGEAFQSDFTLWAGEVTQVLDAVIDVLGGPLSHKS